MSVELAQINRRLRFWGGGQPIKAASPASHPPIDQTGPCERCVDFRKIGSLIYQPGLPLIGSNQIPPGTVHDPAINGHIIGLEA